MGGPWSGGKSNKNNGKAAQQQLRGEGPTGNLTTIIATIDWAPTPSLASRQVLYKHYS